MRVWIKRTVCLALLMLNIGLAGNLAATELNNEFSYLQYYEKALANQLKAYDYCISEMKKVRAMNSVTGKDAEDRKKVYKKLLSLRSHFMRKMLAMTKKLAAEHYKAAKKLDDKGGSEDAMVHFSDSARHWEDLAHLYEQEAAFRQQEAKYYDSAGLNEKAFYAYKSAQSKWNMYIDIAKTMKMTINKSADEKIRALYFSGLDALRYSQSQYQQASQQHARIAGDERIEPQKLSHAIGVNWEIAAKASENFQRLTELSRRLEENMFENYSLAQ